ncbi:MAG: hypothetical protein P8J33_16250 [Pirellulaceae bacterium]|nr:hypothetical protein [Pirellulaceae bacterium]
MRRFLISLLFGVLLCGTPNAKAATQDKSSNAQPEGVEWTERFNQQFLKRAPLLDQTAPQVSAFNDQGNAFALSRTRGKYTVLVFGCLT